MPIQVLDSRFSVENSKKNNATGMFLSLIILNYDCHIEAYVYYIYISYVYIYLCFYMKIYYIYIYIYLTTLHLMFHYIIIFRFAKIKIQQNFKCFAVKFLYGDTFARKMANDCYHRLVVSNIWCQTKFILLILLVISQLKLSITPCGTDIFMHVLIVTQRNGKVSQDDVAI